MKTVWLTLVMFLWQMPLALGAEYAGKNIDGRTFPAQVYSYETGAIFDAQVQFKQNQVTIEFPAGGRLTARLQQPVIRDLRQIEVFGSPGRIHVSNFFSIGFNYGASSDNLTTSSPNSLGNFWRISIDDAYISGLSSGS